VGVIGTRATIESGLYQRLLAASGLDVVARATPLLASAIEEGFHQGAVSEALLAAYLGDGVFDEVDALVLGCTHYPLIADQIANHLPPHIEVVNSPDLVAEAVAAHFLEECDGPATADHRFLVSDWTDSFAHGARRFFGESIRLEASDLWRS
jgi:glutamate racemase